ncbi:proline--tRNA ligase [Prochlorococcus sp. MIT 1307]|uniref:proline--tRNA ligase n=1 Tax=Prochlorococcus sp. MIT 1307 TaxID=3096219 RepID=UPI002A752DA5|nr:proline--tRNA ligase [Prochlorococcus sp. MIT 1307]
MRVSRLMLVTLRDVPAEAEITSHQLLLRGGFIRRITAGVYAYMPLLWRVLSKITKIVQQEMDSAGCLQTLLPQLHPAELWEKSGRWTSYTAGEGIMFHLEDRQGRKLGLGPTHEEIITKIAGDLLNSYKQLPVSLYQIQTKFRDEIRPRFGLMRSREFIMKDAYSFHANEEDLRNTYNTMHKAYKQIFLRCGVQTVPVDADSGAIGGSGSQEFMVTAESGEDLILLSLDGLYSANQEKAVSKAPEALALANNKPSILETPNQKSIEDLCKSNNLLKSQILKVILTLAVFEDGEQQPILISIRGDQELNNVKLINVLTKKRSKGVLGVSQITPEQLKVQGLEVWPFGSIGPDLTDSILNGAKQWNNKFLRIADKTAAELTNFVCGANTKDQHRIFMNWELLGGLPEQFDLRNAKAGDLCLHDPSQKLIEKRGIEVGHIFQLGRKYSQALGASFTNEEGKQEPFIMGCYGIGISRLAQAAVEQNHDEIGICWPIAIAPFEVIVVIANIKDPSQKDLGEKLYQFLQSKGIDTLLDDRAERAGVKFKDADLIGIPWRIVVGRDAASGKVELVKRSNKQSKLLSSDKAMQKLLEEIFAERT